MIYQIFNKHNILHSDTVLDIYKNKKTTSNFFEFNTLDGLESKYFKAYICEHLDICFQWNHLDHKIVTTWSYPSMLSVWYWVTLLSRG